jgi:DNA repair ATPase RecN
MSEKLKQNLEELQTELKKIGSENPNLKKLSGEVDHALEQTGEVSRTLVHALQYAAEEFETKHPQLTAVINNVMTSLSNIGI